MELPVIDIYLIRNPNYEIISIDIVLKESFWTSYIYEFSLLSNNILEIILPPKIANINQFYIQNDFNFFFWGWEEIKSLLLLLFMLDLLFCIGDA